MISSAISPSPQQHPLRVRLLCILIAAAALGLAATLLVAVFFPNNDELASRTARALENALCVPVSIGALNWQLLPQPRVELLDIAISQPTASGTADDADAAPGKVGGGAAAGSGAAGRRTAGPLALQRVTRLPALSLASLWHRTVHFRRVEVGSASVPQRTLRGSNAPPTCRKPPSLTSRLQHHIFGIMLAAVPLETLVWRGVS